jgi:lipopolysaccharide transport system ATP-binding protein
MYVRLAFAVAAHLEPEILIVDEVLAVGDAAFQKKCLGKMGEVASREGRTVLFVSHNVAAVESLCSSGLLLEMGCLRKTGLPPAVIAEYLNLSTARLSVAAPKKKGSQYIRSFVMKDRLGIARDSFQIGEDIIFEIELYSDAPIDHPRYGIGIHNLRGERVTTLHTDVQQNEKWKLNGTKLMRAVWRNVPLNVGQYRVDTSLWGYDYEIETLTGCKILEMQARDVYKTGFLLDPTYQGYLIPDAHWEMNLEQRKG